MNAHFWLRAGALFGFLAVALGSFGAHWLKDHLESAVPAAFESAQTQNDSSRPPLTAARRLEVFDTGVRYQMFHALALLALGLWVLYAGNVTPPAQLAGWSFIAGIILFSGSLYLLGFTGLRWLGAITPLGGIAFLVGWAALFVSLGTTSPRT
jgi:uncharacterized membrane protein YgdD (TMEM256/DUF423 family)